MKIQLMSDLHLEVNSDFRAQAVPGTEVLVLAGDIGSYQQGSRLLDDDFGLRRFSPRRTDSPWKTVIYVPGNHEYDALDFDLTHARLRALCEELGIVWLEQAIWEAGSVRFVGTTLWSDFDALAKHSRTVTEAYTQREKAFRAANYYLQKNTSLRNGLPLLAEDIRNLALSSQQWLREALATPFDGKTVVVTHFAPSLRSADPRYGVTPGTAGFCNSLDELFSQVHLWLHGHLHCANDYRVDGCRVVSNPLGYSDKGEQQAYRPDLCIDVGTQ